jgi:O-antigen biosynthesis protein
MKKGILWLLCVAGFAQEAVEERLNEYLDRYPSAWIGHREFAEWLVQEMKPMQIVDLGIDYGHSTFIFANAARKNRCGVVTGIDWFQGDSCAGARDTYSIVTDAVRDLPLANVEIIKGDFQEVAATWTRPIDILHIDGDHSYEAVVRDYNTWCRFVREDGIILMHDINVPVPGFEVIHVFREINCRYKLHFLPSCGLGILLLDNHKLYQAIKERFPEVREGTL